MALKTKTDAIWQVGLTSPAISVETASLPFWDFCMNGGGNLKCDICAKPDHVVNKCWYCLKQRVGYEAISGGCTSKTFVQLSLAYEDGVEVDGVRVSMKKHAEKMLGCAQARDLDNPLLLCAMATIRAQTGDTMFALEAALGEFAKVTKREDAPWMAVYNFAATIDKLANCGIKDNTRGRAACIAGSKKAYKDALEVLKDRDCPPRCRELINSRLDVLDKCKLDEYLPEPEIVSVPREMLEEYVKNWKPSKDEPLKPDRFMDDNPLLVECMREVNEEEETRKAEKQKIWSRRTGESKSVEKQASPRRQKSLKRRKSSVDRELGKLLRHLRGDDPHQLPVTNVRHALLDHFQSTLTKDGSIYEEMTVALAFFGETCGSPPTKACQGKKNKPSGRPALCFSGSFPRTTAIAA